MDTQLLIIVAAVAGVGALLFFATQKSSASAEPTVSAEDKPGKTALRGKKNKNKKNKKKGNKAGKKKNQPKVESVADVEAAPAAADAKKEKKLSRNQRRKRNARARQAEKEKEEKEQKLKEKVNGGKKKSSKKSTAPSTATQKSPKQKQEEARKRLAEYKRDAEEGWETVGDKSKGQDKSKNKKKKKGGDKKAVETKKSAPALPTGVSISKLDVDPRHYGKIIGSGGVTLKAIMEKSGANIRMPRRDADPPSRTVTIEGTSDAIGAAKGAIHELVTKGYSRLLNPEIAEGSISIDPKLHGLVIGPKGSVIKAIKEKTGVQISLPSSESKSRRIKLSGSKNGIKNAKAAIKFISQYRYTPLLNPRFTHCEVTVPEGKMSYIIGAKGSTRRHIEGNTKAKIHTPMRGDENQNVIIVGFPDCVEKAKNAILKIVNKPEDGDDEVAAEEEYYDEDEEDQPDEIAAQYLIDTSKQQEEEVEEYDQGWNNTSSEPVESGGAAAAADSSGSWGMPSKVAKADGDAGAGDWD